MHKFNITINVLISSLWLYCHTVSSQIVHSEIIQNDNVVKELFTARGGLEGWTWVSFLIDVNGKPKEIVILDYSGKERFLESSISYINNLTFAPASLDGVSIVSEKIMFIQHTFSGVGYSAGTITPVFAERFQQALDVINSTKDISNARLLIDNLKEQYTKNLEEHSLIAWLEANYHYKAQNFLEYLRNIQITVNLHQYLPLKILSRAIVNLFEAQLYYGYYIEAKQTLNLMKSIEGLNLSAQVARIFQEKLDSKIEANIAIQVKGQLTELGKWIYYTNIQKFKIKPVDGIINSVELRCVGFNKVYTFGWQTEIEIPSYAKECVTLIQGQQGTTFDLIQI